MKKTDQKAIIYTDGASRGNPGKAGAGFVIYSPEGKKIGEGSRYLGIKTNNQAEYYALLFALEETLTLGIKDIEIKSDSELLVKQLNGEYRVKSPSIKPLYEQVRKLMKNFENVSITHVKREYNKEADRLANKGIDEA